MAYPQWQQQHNISHDMRRQHEQLYHDGHDEQDNDSTHDEQHNTSKRRPRRNAKSRREQQQRAFTRATTKLLQRLHNIEQHRGNQLSRAGQAIKDALVSIDNEGNHASTNRAQQTQRRNMPVCKHYLQGRCTFGRDCRFNHVTTQEHYEHYDAQHKEREHDNGHEKPHKLDEKTTQPTKFSIDEQLQHHSRHYDVHTDVHYYQQYEDHTGEVWGTPRMPKSNDDNVDNHTRRHHNERNYHQRHEHPHEMEGRIQQLYEQWRMDYEFQQITSAQQHTDTTERHSDHHHNKHDQNRPTATTETSPRSIDYRFEFNQNGPTATTRTSPRSIDYRTEFDQNGPIGPTASSSTSSRSIDYRNEFDQNGPTATASTSPRRIDYRFEYDQNAPTDPTSTSPRSIDYRNEYDQDRPTATSRTTRRRSKEPATKDDYQDHDNDVSRDREHTHERLTDDKQHQASTSTEHVRATTNASVLYDVKHQSAKTSTATIQVVAKEISPGGFDSHQA